jgi:hypothetical protein
MSYIYEYRYYQRSDGIQSWKNRSLKFGDAMAALCYAHDIPWDYLEVSFPECFKRNELGRLERHPYSVDDQIEFMQEMAQRHPKRVLEIGGGRGEVANVLTHMGIPTVSIETGPDCDRWYRETGQQFFGNDALVQPLNIGLDQARRDLDLSEFDTIIMVETLEHIPVEEFDPFWDHVVEKFRGRFVVTNWKNFHPIWVGRGAGPQEHCRLVDDDLYDRFSSQAREVVIRDGSHLVLDL